MNLKDFSGFSGPDASIDISLFEYGLIWKKEGEGTKFIYGIAHDGEKYTRFDYGFMDEAGWKSLCREKWFQLESIVRYCGADETDFISFFPDFMADALRYHGYENVFGTSYTEGFPIEE